MWINKVGLFDETLQKKFYKVTYQSDKLKVKALMYEPNTVKRIVMYLRGGKGNVGQIRTARLMQFAYPDTMVIGPYYRGYEGNGKDEFGGSDQEDVLSLVRLLQMNYPDVPIHFIGFSRGGLQGLLTFEKAQVDSFVFWGGVSSIYYMYEERKDLRGMLHKLVGDIHEVPNEYDKREAINHITTNASPIMIIHGEEDTNVGVKHAYMLDEKLNALNVPHEMHIIPNEPHVLSEKALEKTLGSILEFFEVVESKDYKTSEKDIID